MKKISIAVIIGILIITGCSKDPITGKNTFNTYSEADEISLGKQYHPQIINQYGEYKNNYLTQYIQSIVNRLVEVGHRPHLEYQVTVLDTPEINAFALPGGHVYICRGLLAYLNSEAELAAVMGHEIGHVNARHSVERQSKQVCLSNCIGISSLFFKNSGQAQLFESVGSTIASLTLLSYSREDEMEADRLAIEYTHRANFSPLGTGLVMGMFEKLSADKANTPLSSTLSTHPVSSLRSKQARIEIRKIESEEFIKKELYRDRYLGAIDGLHLGNSLAKGDIVDNVYYNTNYGLKIPISQNYQTQTNQGGYLLISAKKDNQSVTFYRVTSAKENISVLQKEFRKTLKANPQKSEHIKWNNTKGLLETYLKETESITTYNRISHFVAGLGDNWLEVINVESISGTSLETTASKKQIANISIIKANEKRNLKQNRLKIYSKKPGDTWQSITKKHFKNADPKKLAWANGCEIDSPLPQFIKLFLF